MCPKSVYTKKEAQTNLNLLRKGRHETIHGVGRRRKIKHRPIRIYYCNRCGGWHLTSTPLEDIIHFENINN